VSSTNPSTGSEGLPDNVSIFIDITPQDNDGNVEDVTQTVTVSVVVPESAVSGIPNPTLFHDVNSNGTYTQLETRASTVPNGTRLNATTTGLSPFAVGEVTQPTNPFPGGVPQLGGGGGTGLAPTDTDNDGKFEDINGDGEFTFDDAIALAFADTSGFNTQQQAAVDFDNDGDVDFDDAIELAFEE
jgi:PKD repeat protein